MRGSSPQQSSMLCLVSMEDRVPQDHPLRPMKKMADRALAELSPVFDAMYAASGRPSVPPERLLKALLLQALFSIRSERYAISDQPDRSQTHRGDLRLVQDRGRASSNTLSGRRSYPTGRLHGGCSLQPDADVTADTADRVIESAGGEGRKPNRAPNGETASGSQASRSSTPPTKGDYFSSLLAKGNLMKIVINGARVDNFATFVAKVAQGISPGDTEPRYFGFDLDSFGDCLQGGYLGAPPYDIVVEHAEPMVAAMDHRGLIRYCDDMLGVIDDGGRGLVREDSRHWYESTRDAAKLEVGPTLLRLLMDVIQTAPATLTLLDDNRSVIATSTDKSD